MILKSSQGLEEVRKIIHTIRQVGGGGMSTRLMKKMEKHIKSYWEALINKELKNLEPFTQEEEDKKKKLKQESAMRTLLKFAKGFQITVI